jgi:hypothetical protein
MFPKGLEKSLNFEIVAEVQQWNHSGLCVVAT